MMDTTILKGKGGAGSRIAWLAPFNTLFAVGNPRHDGSQMSLKKGSGVSEGI